MNPSQEEPTKEELLDGELSEEELYTIAAGTKASLNVLNLVSVDVSFAQGGS